MKKKLVITGGTGFMGSLIINSIHKKFEIVYVGRNDLKTSNGFRQYSIDNIPTRYLNDTISVLHLATYYSKNSDDCSEVLPLEREIEKKYKSNIVNTIRGLLTVLDEKESNQGWSTNIPIGTYLKYINIKSGVAEISLTSSLDTTAGSCAVTAVRSQIEKTLTQFPYISSVNICVEENCNQDEILQP